MTRLKVTRLWLCLPAALAVSAQAPPKVNQGASVLQDFANRTAAYLKIRKAAQSEVPRLKPTNSAQEIQVYERSLAAAIRQKRTGAAQGALFTPAITAEFRRLIGLTMKGPEAARIRESLQSAAPVGKIVLRVNQAYPTQLPLQSSPPSLLLNLPPLPKELEYRVVGHDLLLRDPDANLVVDFILNIIA